MTDTVTHTPTTSVERLTQFDGSDLHDLCDAADAAILDGGGFGWIEPPTRHLMRMPKNNEAQTYTGQLTTFFLAPGARG